MRYALAVLSGVLLIHGWYPQPCCGDWHCKAVPCDQLIEQDNGDWIYVPTWTVFDSYRIAPSQDRNCHVCIIGGQGACAFIQMGM
jgi:hypothetical protein